MSRIPALFSGNQAIEVGPHLLKKLFATEPPGVLCYLLRNCVDGSHSLHRGRNGLHGLLVEEYAGRSVGNRFDRAAFAKRNNGPAARHRLDRHHPEVFLTWKNQCTTPRVVVPENIKWLWAKHLDGRARQSTNLGQHVTAANHNEI
jgi:hypothetical protein